MKSKRFIATLLSVALSATALFSMTGCGAPAAPTPEAPAAPAGDTAQAAPAAPAAAGKTKEVAIMVPSADHGWTGAVLTYAQEDVTLLSADPALAEKYTFKVYAATDVEDQIKQVDDLLSNVDILAGIVILPYDNGLQSTLEKIAAANVPFVQFDRVISSEAIDAKVVANVKGDNEGIGYETAKRMVEKGLAKGDSVYEMIGDNSSVPELRSKGFRDYLVEQGWTEEEVGALITKSAATGWSRDTGKELFESWFGSPQCDPAKNNWIYTHDDEIAMGVLESLNGAALDATKKASFMATFKGLSASSGLAEIYAVLKDKHQTVALPTEFDLFSVTYDPAMIQEAVQVMVDHLNGKTDIKQDYVIPVNVVDSANVGEYKPFGNYDEK